MRSSLTSVLLALVVLAPTAAQQQRPAPSTTAPPAPTARQEQQPVRAEDDADDVVRITTNLVQVDVIVTDKDGRQVRDLRPEEFSIYEDSKEQQLTNFSYVPTVDAAAAGTPAAGASSSSSSPSAPAPRRGRELPPAPSAPPRYESVRRTIALVLDDLAIRDMYGVAAAQQAMRKFVDEQMRPGDLVGVYGTRGGSGALQQFTTDKAQLHKAIDALRWLPPSLIYMPPEVSENEEDTPPDAGESVRQADAAIARAARERIEQTGHDIIAYGVLGTLGYVINGMELAPGRKSVVLFANGPPFQSRKPDRTRDRLNRVIESANRASTAIYTIDIRGMFNPTWNTRYSAEHGTLPAGEDNKALRLSRPEPTGSPVGARSVLSEDTGGLFFHSSNDFNKVLGSVLEDQSGYYLLGYRPSEQTFKGGEAAYRRISVKVKRPGLRVRTRSGFTAVTDADSRREARGADRELYGVLASPVNAGDIHVRLTAGFADLPAAGGPAARMLLHIDGQRLTFADDAAAAGWKKLTLDVSALTLDKDGKLIDEFTRTHTVRAGGDVLEHIRQHGLTYAADVPVRKPGAYQLRIAVRDAASQKLGSAGQFIDVPDLAAGRLAASGLTLRAVEEQADDGATTPTQRPAAAPATAETALAPVMSPADPAVRRYVAGQALAYSLQIYNATIDPATRRPALTAQVRLYRGGELVFDGQPEPLDTSAQTDAARLRAEQVISLADAKTGAYVLQVVVTDALAKGDKAQATQWIDFEVVD